MVNYPFGIHLMSIDASPELLCFLIHHECVANMVSGRRMCEYHLKDLGLSKTCTFRRTTTVGTSAPEASSQDLLCVRIFLYSQSPENYYRCLAQREPRLCLLLFSHSSEVDRTESWEF